MTKKIEFLRERVWKNLEDVLWKDEKEKEKILMEIKDCEDEDILKGYCDFYLQKQGVAYCAEVERECREYGMYVEDMKKEKETLTEKDYIKMVYGDEIFHTFDTDKGIRKENDFELEGFIENDKNPKIFWDEDIESIDEDEDFEEDFEDNEESEGYEFDFEDDEDLEDNGEIEESEEYEFDFEDDEDLEDNEFEDSKEIEEESEEYEFDFGDNEEDSESDFEEESEESKLQFKGFEESEEYEFDFEDDEEEIEDNEFNFDEEKPEENKFQFEGFEDEVYNKRQNIQEKQREEHNMNVFDTRTERGKKTNKMFSLFSLGIDKSGKAGKNIIRKTYNSVDNTVIEKEDLIDF